MQHWCHANKPYEDVHSYLEIRGVCFNSTCSSEVLGEQNHSSSSAQGRMLPKKRWQQRASSEAKWKQNYTVHDKSPVVDSREESRATLDEDVLSE